MQYLLDSDAISALTNPKSVDNALMMKYLSSLGENALVSLCILTVYEFEFSISSCGDLDTKARIQKTLESLKNNLSLVGLGVEDAKIYGSLKAKFKEKTGMNQKPLKQHNIDIALASVAIANNAVLVSKDKIYKEHLQKIDNRLQCEGW